MQSIRRRLLMPLVGLYAVGWLATAIYAYYQTQHEVRELFDEELVLIGNTLHSLIDQTYENWEALVVNDAGMDVGGIRELQNFIKDRIENCCFCYLSLPMIEIGHEENRRNWCTSLGVPTIRYVVQRT